MSQAHSRSPESTPHSSHTPENRPIHHDPERLAQHLQRGHDKWRIVEEKDRIKYFKKLASDGLLVETYKEKLRRGQIPPAYDFRGSMANRSDEEVAASWQQSEIHAAQEIIDQLEQRVIEQRQPVAVQEHSLARRTDAALERESPEERLPAPTTDDILPPNKKGHLVDISAIAKRMAWTQAEEKLNEVKNAWRTNRPAEQGTQEETNMLGKFWRGLKGVGKNIGYAVKDVATHPKEFFTSMLVRSSEKDVLQKFYKETLAQMQTDRNLYAEIETSVWGKATGKRVEGDQITKHHQALDAVVEQYLQDVAKAEEKGEVVNDPDVNIEVGNLFYEFATGEVADRAAFEQRVQERVAPIMRAKQKRFQGAGAQVREGEEGVMYASNLFQLAQSYKGYINGKITEMEREHGPENREIIRNHVKGLMAIDIQLGLKERDIRNTKPRDVKSWSAKLVDRLQTVPVLGKFVAMPATWAIGASAAATMGVRAGASGLLKTMCNAPIVGGLMGGLMGAWRRGRDLEYDRGLEMRRAALGQQAGGARATKMREYNYSMRDLGQVAQRLDNILSKTAAEISTDDRNYIAEMYARQAMEDNSSIDLFHESSAQGQRTGMRLHGMTEMKVRLKQLAANNPALSPEALATEINRAAGNFDLHIQERDKNYRGFRRREMAKAGVFAGVVGVGVGALIEAGVGAYHGNYDATSMGRLQAFLAGRNVPVAAGAMHEVVVGNSHVSLRLPDSQEIVNHSDGTFDIIDKATGTSLETGLSLDGSGEHLSMASLAQLRDHGANIIEAQAFHGQFDEVTLPGHPEFTMRVPAGCEFIRSSSGGGYDLIDSMNGRTIAEHLDFETGGMPTPASAAALEHLGWKFDATPSGGTVHITDHDQMLAYLRAKHGGGIIDPTKRNWHTNVDPRVHQVTDGQNPFYHGKLTGGVHENYPYEFKATAQDVAASHRSVQEGILDQPIQEGQNIAGKLIDGKELRVWLEDKGNEYVLDFKGLRDMMHKGAMNWDGSHDHKFAQIKHLLMAGKMEEAARHFRFRFYLNKEDFHHGKAFSLQMGPDAKIHLPKGSMDAEMIVDHSGRHPSLKITGETALYNGNGPARIFATKLGQDVKSIVIPGSTTDLIPPPGVTTIDLPPAVPFFFPIPFMPRMPMEKGKYPRELPPIGPYGYENVKQEIEDIQKDPLVSQTLKENPSAKLQADHEISRYLNLIPEKRAELEMFDAQIAQPMDPECEIAVCIPCASHMEGKNIYHTLEQYAKQVDTKGKRLDPKKFELIIFLNRPKGKSGDESEAEVQRFINTHPDIKLRVIKQETDWGQVTSWGEKVNIGSVCRRIYDVAALRSLKRGTNKDLVIFMSDADTLAMSPKLVANHVETFKNDSEQKVDAVTGDVDWGNELMRDPNLFALTRIWQGLQKQIYVTADASRRNIPSWGANFAMRASAYSAIGGRRDTPVSDLRLGRMIIAARRSRSGQYSERSFPLRYDYANWLDSNPRRYVLSYKRQMNDEDYPADTSLDKIIGPEQSLDVISMPHLEHAIKQCVASLKLDVRSPNTAKKIEDKEDREYCRNVLLSTCENVGLKCKIDDDGVVHVTSIEGLKRKLQRAREGKEFFESLPGGKQDRKHL